MVTQAADDLCQWMTPGESVFLHLVSMSPGLIRVYECVCVKLAE